MTDMLINRELEILARGEWGTIGAYSITAASSLAKYTGSIYGLLCHSADAAYEAVLRQFGIVQGDVVVTGAVSWPANSLVAVCTGAIPVFAPICESFGMISLKGLQQVLAENPRTKCVVLDIVPENLDKYPLDEVQKITRKYETGFVINAGGAFSKKWNGRPLCELCDAVFYSCEEGSEIYCVKGGFVATNYEPIHSGTFAYHNCGRSFGEGCSLDVDGVAGGDLRVSEFTAVIAQHILETGAFAEALPRVFERMEGQPVFEKMTQRK